MCEDCVLPVKFSYIIYMKARSEGHSRVETLQRLCHACGVSAGLHHLETATEAMGTLISVCIDAIHVCAELIAPSLVG